MVRKIVILPGDLETSVPTTNLNPLLQIGKEGESLEMFNPESAINFWFNNNLLRLGVFSSRSSMMKQQ